jgi:hypothetical protein
MKYFDLVPVPGQLVTRSVSDMSHIAYFQSGIIYDYKWLNEMVVLCFMFYWTDLDCDCCNARFSIHYRIFQRKMQVAFEDVRQISNMNSFVQERVDWNEDFTVV